MHHLITPNEVHSFHRQALNRLSPRALSCPAASKMCLVVLSHGAYDTLEAMADGWTEQGEGGHCPVAVAGARTPPPKCRIWGVSSVVILYSSLWLFWQLTVYGLRIISTDVEQGMSPRNLLSVKRWFVYWLTIVWGSRLNSNWSFDLDCLISLK